jgi:hypothetical protein
MKVKVYILTTLLLAASAITYAKDAPGQASEDQIKAAFMYNFIKFTEWPAGKAAEPNTIVIGLLGEHQFGDAFDPVKNKSVKDKRLIIKALGRFSRFLTPGETGKLQLTKEVEELRKCHLLFICDSERENYKAIIEAVKGYNVLTVGETEDFLDIDGIITFIPRTEKPVFEVNLDICEREGLKISSKVLRLARRVISAKGLVIYKEE